jgi:hypothetical protein
MSSAAAIAVLVAEAVGTVEAVATAQQHMREAKVADAATRAAELEAKKAVELANRLAAELLEAQQAAETEAAQKQLEAAASAEATAQAAVSEQSSASPAADAVATAVAEPSSTSEPAATEAGVEKLATTEAPAAEKASTEKPTTEKASNAKKSPAAQSPTPSPAGSPTRGNSLFAAPSKKDAKAAEAAKAKEEPKSLTAQSEQAFHEASERATKILHRLLVHTMHATDSVDMCKAAQFPSLIEAIAEVVGVGHDLPVLAEVGLDTNFALNVASIFANLCVFEDVREYLPEPELCVAIALSCIRHQPMSRRIVHLCLMCVANIALCTHLLLPEETVVELVGAVVPLFDEAPVVEAWSCALCNVASTTSENLGALVQAGAIDKLERLLVYHSDNERVLSRGYQCLTCLSAAFTRPRPAAVAPPAT